VKKVKEGATEASPFHTAWENPTSLVRSRRKNARRGKAQGQKVLRKQGGMTAKEIKTLGKVSTPNRHIIHEEKEVRGDIILCQEGQAVERHVIEKNYSEEGGERLVLVKQQKGQEFLPKCTLIRGRKKGQRRIGGERVTGRHGEHLRRPMWKAFS